MSGLSSDVVLYLMSKGVRQSEIAREYGVSRQYVGQLAKQGGYDSPITKVSRNLPWEVDPAFYANTIYKGVTLHGHMMLAGKEKISATSQSKLLGFYRKLIRFNVVVDYDPDYLAQPGLTNTNGFAYVPRGAADKDYIIKVRPGVRITPLGEKLWRLPSDWALD